MVYYFPVSGGDKLADNTDVSLAEILGRNNRVQAISYCNTEGKKEQIGPHFLAMLPPTTRDGVDYWHGQIIDGRRDIDRRWGHYSMVDGLEAFGGTTKEPSDLFEIIDGKSYKRLKEDDGRWALKDVRGGRYTGVAHDTINRPDHPTPLDGKGVVYHLTDDEKEGWYLNEKLCGMKNGMNHKSTLIKVEKEGVEFKVGDEMVPYRVFLIAENKEGFKKVVDIETGEILFADEDTCLDVELLVMGNEICAKKTYGKHDAELRVETSQELRSENGEKIYYGFTAMAGDWFDGTGGPFQRTYDKKPINPEGTEEERLPGLLTIVEKMSNPSSCRPRFGTKNPARREGTGSPNGDGVFKIDGKQLVQLFVDNPDPSDQNLLVTFPDRHGKDPFRGPHYKLGKTKDDKPRMVTVEGITSVLFENKQKSIYYIGSNGNERFGGQHFDELDTIENWWYDSEGKRRDSPLTLKNFVELSNRHVVRDHNGKAFFPKNPDAEQPEGHTSIRDFWVLSYQKDGENRHVIIAEAEDPVSLGRRIVGLFRGKGWRPSTYYLQDGTKFSSIDALKQSWGAPIDAQLVYAKDFKDPHAEDMKATRDPGRDTTFMEVKSAGVDPMLQAMLKKAEEGKLDKKEFRRIISSADTAEGAGGSLEETLENAGEAASGGKPAKGETTALGATLFPEEGQSADAAELPAPAEEVVAEEQPPGQLPDGGLQVGEQQEGGPDWLKDSPGDGEPQEAEPEPKGDAGTEKAPDKPLSSWLLDDDSPGGVEPSQEGPADDGSSQSGEGDSGQQG